MPTRNDIAFIRSLRDRNTRHTERKFVVEGQKCVVEALDSGWAVHGLYRTEASGFEGHEAEVVSAKDMGRMSAFKTAPGILAVLGMPDVEPPLPEDWAAQPGRVPIGLAVDGLSDPGNLGTLMRTADWFGVEGIWAAKGTVDPFNPKVIQASMGAVFRVPIWSVDLPDCLAVLGTSGCSVFGLDMTGMALWSLDGAPAIGSKWCAVVGNESHGLSEGVRSAGVAPLHIPGGGGSESLNATMAAGMVLSDWARRCTTN
ncbi:MAG: TrmH family RNA methyltransferase [Flavobacteriales bacterium]